MTSRPLLALLALLALPAVALAQSDEAEPTPAATEPNIQYKAITDIDFGVQRVDASMLKPYGQFVGGLPQREKTPLVTLKPDFNAEMRASVDSVR